MSVFQRVCSTTGTIVGIWKGAQEAAQNTPGAEAAGVQCCCDGYIPKHAGFVWTHAPRAWIFVGDDFPGYAPLVVSALRADPTAAGPVVRFLQVLAGLRGGAYAIEATDSWFVVRPTFTRRFYVRCRNDGDMHGRVVASKMDAPLCPKILPLDEIVGELMQVAEAAAGRMDGASSRAPSVDG